MKMSKSKYCAGLQCPKILWMDRSMPEQKAAPDESRFTVGNEIGDLAMGYFGNFTEVAFNRESMSEMIAETQRLLAEGNEQVIAEASFSFEDNFCSVDLLRRAEDGYEIIEVKSSSAKTQITPIYLHDMAYQYYVLTSCGLNITKVSLMQLNPQYVRRGALDLDELFVVTDCTDMIREMQYEIPERIASIRAIAALDDEPDTLLGMRCDNPYECGYKGWCYRNLPENNVFNIGFGMRSAMKEQAHYDGIISFGDVLNSGLKLTEKQLRQVTSTVSDLPPDINKRGIRRFLETLTYPLYHLDFETYQQHIPLWDGVHPYQQIPFQYSLHIQDAPCGEALHREFLAKEGIDPRRELAERLCADIPPDVCVLAYNKSFEQACIRGLAVMFPDLSDHMLCISENMRDLMQPFKNGDYYSREMGGSYSIKVVLPAMCGDDPELDYHALEHIHNGGEAMAAYATLHIQPSDEIERIRAALLAYCRLDTLAMVKILEKLYEMAGG